MANAQDHATGNDNDRGLSGMIGDAGSQVGETVQKVGRQARRAATSLASDANDKVIGLMDKQVGAGADLTGYVASAFRSAADDLEQNAPQRAGFVYDAAERIERLSDPIREQSAGDLFRAGSDFARRRPALIFGGAAILGFLLYRVVNAPTNSSSRLDDWEGGSESWDELEGESDFGDGQPSTQTAAMGAASGTRTRRTSTASQSRGE